MPVATVSQKTERKDLKTLEGGFVELKQLSFDQILERRDKAMRMSMEQKPNRKKDDTARVEFESAMQWDRFFTFSTCIVDHNLEDENGKPLNFNNRMTLKALDPKIGSEIEKYIEEMNEDEDEESLEDFMKRHSSSSSQETQQPSSDSDTN
jgi:hypothetical protein